jgi:hypothetical protein
MGSLLRSKNFVSQLVQRRFVPSSDFVTSDILAGRAELQNSAAVRRLLIAPYNRVSAQGTGTVRGSHKLPRTNRRIADVRDASARRGRARPSWNAPADPKRRTRLLRSQASAAEDQGSRHGSDARGRTGAPRRAPCAAGLRRRCLIAAILIASSTLCSRW